MLKTYYIVRYVQRPSNRDMRQFCATQEEARRVANVVDGKVFRVTEEELKLK